MMPHAGTAFAGQACSLCVRAMSTSGRHTEPVRLADGRTIPESAIGFHAALAGGPGGQHVNRTATNVQLTVNVEDLPLTDAERERVCRRLASRINSEGVLRVSSRRHRSQLDNRLDARRRLASLIDGAIRVSAPRTSTRPSKGERERRLVDKHHAAERKSRRRRVDRSADDD